MKKRPILLILLAICIRSVGYLFPVDWYLYHSVIEMDADENSRPNSLSCRMYVSMVDLFNTSNEWYPTNTDQPILTPLANICLNSLIARIDKRNTGELEQEVERIYDLYLLDTKDNSSSSYQTSRLKFEAHTWYSQYYLFDDYLVSIENARERLQSEWTAKQYEECKEWLSISDRETEITELEKKCVVLAFRLNS